MTLSRVEKSKQVQLRRRGGGETQRGRNQDSLDPGGSWRGSRGKQGGRSRREGGEAGAGAAATGAGARGRSCDGGRARRRSCDGGGGCARVGRSGVLGHPPSRCCHSPGRRPDRFAHPRPCRSLPSAPHPWPCRLSLAAPCAGLIGPICRSREGSLPGKRLSWSLTYSARQIGTP